MTEKEAQKRIATWAEKAWPISARTENECWRKAHAESGGLNFSVHLFQETLAKIGLVPRKFGEIWILRLPGPSPTLAAGAIRCEGF